MSALSRRPSSARRIRHLAPVVAFVLLCGCAGPTPYQPATAGYGYADRQLEANRYRVTFLGNAATPRSTVDDYLLYRAAEITLATGNDYFVIAGRETEPMSEGWYGGYPVVAPGYGWYGAGSGFALGLSIPLGGGPSTRYRAIADILVFNGVKPGGDPYAYDAREVRAWLGPSVIRATAERR